MFDLDAALADLEQIIQDRDRTAGYKYKDWYDREQECVAFIDAMFDNGAKWKEVVRLFEKYFWKMPYTTLHEYYSRSDFKHRK